MFRKIFLASLCFLLLAACVPVSEPETTAGDQISIERDTDTTPANTDAATKLALRLLAPRYPGAPDVGDVQLLVGELPADFTLPLPDTVEIVGSLVRGTEGTEVVLDSSQSAEFILNYYTEEMPKVGWETFEEPYYGGGFVPGDMPQNKTFCNDEDDLVMWVTALDLEDAPTDVHFSINPTHGYSPCDQGSMGGPPSNDPYALMPALVPPPGVRQIGGGGGGSGADGISSNATLETNIPTADLLTHYNAQLKEAGWTADSEDANSPVVSWSTWTFSDSDDNNWRGLFLATQLDDEHRTVYVEIIRLK